MDKQRIGFVGLGLMGSGMVKNLLAAGFPVMGYARDEKKVVALRRLGCKKVDFPERMAAEADVIILSLPGSHVVNEVVRNTLKLTESGSKGLIVIDTGTADPILSEELAARLRAKGVEMLDAPVSGTSKMCAQKDVIFMVGGKEEAFQACLPIFSAMGREALYLGKNGAGAATKMIVQLILGLNRMALAEGLTLAKKVGMDRHRLLEILKKSAAYSKAMDMKGSRMIDKEFLPPEGKMGGFLRTSRLVLDFGNRVNAPLLLFGLQAQALASEVSKGRSEWDTADIISFYEELANV